MSFCRHLTANILPCPRKILFFWPCWGKTGTSDKEDFSPERQGWCGLHWVQQLPGMAASHMGLLDRVLAIVLPIQLSTKVFWKAASDGFSSWDPATHMGDLAAVPGFWLPTGPVLGIAAIKAAPQQTENLYLSMMLKDRRPASWITATPTSGAVETSGTSDICFPSYVVMMCTCCSAPRQAAYVLVFSQHYATSELSALCHICTRIKMPCKAYLRI